ncbi:MAG: 3-oxoacyl-[acyl-carrier-protein] reductase [Thermacetogeniaceae bacterium]
MFLENKVALVTGASQGIGRAIALALANHGAMVAINYYPGQSENADLVVEEITRAGGKALAVAADVSRRTAVEEMMDTVSERCGAVDILVNNAGITRDQLLLRMKDEDWTAVLETNLNGVFYCTRAALKGMLKKRWGRIVNIASVVGVIGNAGQANYGAAKAGIIGFTKCVAREVASRGVTANAIAPGYIGTEMTGRISPEAQEELQRRIPLGRIGKPEDVAGAVVFLVSPAGEYITGQVLHVDGGMAI